MTEHKHDYQFAGMDGTKEVWWCACGAEYTTNTKGDWTLPDNLEEEEEGNPPQPKPEPKPGQIA